ncbi:efflux RND transporter periplasmic adaptor subunit [Gilvimarinus sp. F26214L]|uniref:efflux RND transporter periplasmic adaptor subunit n=1 Tax=Gilvimarinus sp. DZF01 TaxID=3461371 RepID=UPI0040451F49
MKRPRFLIPTALLVATATLLAACSDDGKTQQTNGGSQGPLRVIVAAVEETPQRTRVEAVGTSRAVQSVTLYPVTSGEVVAVNFEPGQAVSKGDVLVEMDERNERLAVQLAEVRVADAERLYERYKRSAQSGATLPTTLDAAHTALEEARIELDQARIALDDRSIEAPFDGYVGITDVDPGDRIQPSTAITTLDNRSALLVSFELPEMLVGTLRSGDQVAISTWNSRQPSAYGSIVDIDSRVDPTSRTFVARARVDNEGDRLRPGQSFRVALEVLGDNYLVVPEISVQWGADGAYVWSVVGKEGRRVPVNVIQRQQGVVLLDGPLARGDLIVVEGIQRMRPGIEVKPELAPPGGDVGATLSRNMQKGPG